MSSTRETREARALVLAAASLAERTLVPDLRESVRPWAEATWRLTPALYSGQRFESWFDALVEESSGTWVVAAVLLRLTEDFGLAPYVRANRAGTGRVDEAEASQWLKELARLLAPHGPLGSPPPLPESARRKLLELFREQSNEGPRWRSAVRVPSFMADLFFALTRQAREQHAFLATPPFIAEFLVEHTVEPAAKEFGGEALRIMDPACGSGLLLEAAFRKLLELRGRGARVSYPEASGALAQLQGMDISLFACAMTRCTLLRALLQSVDSPERVRPQEVPLNIHTGNALLELAPAIGGPEAHRYQVVLVEPPFIAERNPKLRMLYRERYESARFQFSLMSPFVELAFSLLVEDGFFGALLSHSFMKRRYGEALVERVLARQHLTTVVDLSGAYLPGHGTPSMMLLARRKPPDSSAVRTVLCHQGEPITPSVPEQGRVWMELREHIDEPGFEGHFVTVSDVPRQTFARHPWVLVLGGPGAALAHLERGGPVRLKDCVLSTWRAPARFAGVVATPEVFSRQHVPRSHCRIWLGGRDFTDWSLREIEINAIPDLSREVELAHPLLFRVLGGLGWLLPREAEDSDLRRAVARMFSWSLQGSENDVLVGFPVVARQNSFVRLEAGQHVSSTAGGLMLPGANAHERESSMALLAYLNSSTAWFWMRQFFASMSLGERQPARYFLRESGASNMSFRFSFGELLNLPVPQSVLSPGTVRTQLAERARKLEQLAQRRRMCEPRFVLGDESAAEEAVPRGSMPVWDRASRSSLIRALARAFHEEELLFREMVFHQEEIDWLVYEAWGLARSEPLGEGRALPEQRPFEWSSERPPDGLRPELAQAWLERRHQRNASRLLRALDARECKRGWFAWKRPRRRGQYDSIRTREACAHWLLIRVESLFRAQRSPIALTMEEIAEALSSAVDVQAVAEVREGSISPDLTKLLAPLVEDTAVPFLASYRLSSTGLKKWEGWKQLWSLQRRGPVTPRDARELAHPYEMRDFRRSSWWTLRGPLDLPRERFISYPLRGAESETRYSWAGWTFPQQAQVLEALYREGRSENWTARWLLPILQGVEELLPWIEQWHEPDAPRWGGFLDGACGELGVTREALSRLEHS